MASRLLFGSNFNFVSDSCFCAAADDKHLTYKAQSYFYALNK